MRRLTALVASGLVAIPPAAAAREAGTVPAGRSQRVEEVAYEPNPWNIISIDPGAVTGSPGVSITTVEVHVRRGERALSVKASDDLGHPVRISVVQERSVIKWFCNESPGPLPVRPGVVTIYVFSGVCGSSAAAATTGTLEVTYFSRLPAGS